MAYRLKKVSYRDNNIHILLQNENGPCPLIAAANALLLRGALALDPSTIRANVISIQDLTSCLAEFALQRSTHIHHPHPGDDAGWKTVTKGKNKKDDTTENSRGSVDDTGAIADTSAAQQKSDSTQTPTAPPTPEEEDEAIMMRRKHQERHVDEMISLLPQLQYGLDLNPKFTQGPDGCEYTVGLTTFDVLGVDLVHGWLVDPQDASLHAVLQNKTYNALVDLVIQGNEASSEVDSLTKLIEEKERALEEVMLNGWVDVDKQGAVEGEKDEEEGEEKIEKKEEIEKEQEKDMNVDENEDKANKATPSSVESDKKEPSSETNPEPTAGDESNPTESTKDDPNKQTPPTSDDSAKPPANTLKPPNTETLQEEITTLKTKLDQAHQKSTKGHLINNFLNETGHQLTYYGLEQLHSYLADYQLCVFFRNNHYSTITKHNGTLFLLVTDLGYASEPDVVWERLDGIDGDTDYVDCQFARTKPKSQLGPSAPILSPEQVLSQKGQHELDYQLAMRLQGGGEGGQRPMTDAAIAQEEAALIAAATEESLNTFHAAGTGGGSGGSAVGGGGGTVVALPNSSAKTAETSSANGGAGGSGNAAEEADRALAMALQAQMESEDASVQLARRLQAEEEQRGRRTPQQRGRAGGARSGASPAQAAAGDDGRSNNCVIS